VTGLLVNNHNTSNQMELVMKDLTVLLLLTEKSLLSDLVKPTVNVWMVISKEISLDLMSKMLMIN
jgi:hypothetical protein